jgi:PHD/YefM family antitoxin component YafN of YafNO toxin-antitoxin module
MTTLPPAVHPLAEIREQLSQVVTTFRTEGATAEPVIFGSHRKPEAVLLSYEVYQHLLEQITRTRSVAAAFASVRAEGLEPTSAAVARSERFVRGEISEDEAYAETLRQYRRS